MALFFQGLQVGQTFRFVGVVFRVLGRFQAMPNPSSRPAKLF